MCGILFCTSTEARTCRAVHKRYKKQRARGTNGFGYVTIKDGQIEHVQRSTTENEILEPLRHETAPSIMFHHRTPTSTPNYWEATHPFFISDPRFKSDYYIIHNGVISNWEALYEKYKSDGYQFKTEMRESSSVRFPNIDDSRYEFDEEIKINDSEALAIDLAKYFEGLSIEIESRGSIAFIAVKTTKDGKVEQLIYGHNGGNPMIKEQDKTLFCLKSEGHGDKVPVDVIHYMNWQTKEVTTEDKDIGSYYGRTTGFQGTKDVPPRSTTPWQKQADGTYKPPEDHVRHLHPTHPILPGQMQGSLKEVGAAMARTKMLEEARVAKDDERIADFEDRDHNVARPTEHYLGNHDEPDYQAAVTEAEVDRLLGEIENEPEEVQELRKDLRRALYNADAAQHEVDDAKACLRAVINVSGSIEDSEAAASLLSAAEAELASCRREINNVTAELSAWI